MEIIPKKPEAPVETINDRVDRVKGLAVMNNLHNLAPPARNLDNDNSVAIIKALQSDELINKSIMELKGYMFDPMARKWVKFREAVMNEQGLGNFIYTISTIAETIEFGHFKEEEIPKMSIFLFKHNFPAFTIYYREFGLEKKDFNIIATKLFSFIVSAFSKGKNAGHRNVIRGTYSEDLLSKAVEREKQKKDSFITRLTGGNRQT